MTILVRKIAKSKWPAEECLQNKSDDEIIPTLRADAVTSCLRTSGDTLSLWAINDINDVEKAILSLITSPKHERLNTIHIALIHLDKITEQELELKETIGDTVISSYSETHRDLVELDYRKIGFFCKIILSSIRDGNIKKVSDRQQAELIKRAASSKIVDQKTLNPKLQYSLWNIAYDINGNEMVKNEDGTFSLVKVPATPLGTSVTNA
ncbi:hypothetical protein LX59_03072 [Azomonas agilis]|uniref:Uncharacterized protein n=1 Tax=Azomonas agilis TaxID=116849 RepID=A0A562HYJ8_9GAMM|nr:hypothetical protein [Azomonas agilis]TWH63821.1 hypothetical protein LX59_03072 [Azomonas agilis]